MPGLGGLYRNFGGFQIANFPDQNHVRILAQEGAQGRGEIHALLRVHVDLIYPFQVDFHRVFRRGDVEFRRIEDIHPGIQRNGFPRASRAGDQDHALGFVQGIQVHLFLFVFVAQRLDAHLGGFWIQDT